MFVGPKRELRWEQRRIEQASLVKVIGQLGGDPTDFTELRVLNCIFRCTEIVICFEADLRHQEILVATEPGRPVLIPGIKEQPLERQQRSG